MREIVPCVRCVPINWRHEVTQLQTITVTDTEAFKLICVHSHGPQENTLLTSHNVSRGDKTALKSQRIMPQTLEKKILLNSLACSSNILKEETLTKLFQG